MYPPYGGLQSAAEQAALVRPWQVTFYAWMVIIGSVACLVAILPIMFVNDATLMSWWVDLDGQADVTVEGLQTARIVVIVADVLTAVIVGINLPLGIALLRGSRGAYLYFVTMLVINIVVVVLLGVLMALLFFVTQSAVSY